jgi:hypothetical protein
MFFGTPKKTKEKKIQGPGELHQHGGSIQDWATCDLPIEDLHEQQHEATQAFWCQPK